MEPGAAIDERCRCTEAPRRCSGGALLLFVLCVPPHGPQRAAGAPIDPTLRADAKFTHLTVEQGLADQRVQAVLQDRTGFLWFGTNNGLDRYDGYRFVSYHRDPANPHSLSSNIIEDLHEDRAGNLWVATRGGLNVLDRRTERFTRYLHDPADPHSISDNIVQTIFEDRAGDLWVGTAGGVNLPVGEGAHPHAVPADRGRGQCAAAVLLAPEGRRGAEQGGRGKGPEDGRKPG